MSNLTVIWHFQISSRAQTSQFPNGQTAPEGNLTDASMLKGGKLFSVNTEQIRQS